MATWVLKFELPALRISLECCCSVGMLVSHVHTGLRWLSSATGRSCLNLAAEVQGSSEGHTDQFQGGSLQLDGLLSTGRFDQLARSSN